MSEKKESQTQGNVLIGVLEILIGLILLLAAAAFIWFESAQPREFQIIVPVALFLLSAAFFITLGEATIEEKNWAVKIYKSFNPYIH